MIYISFSHDPSMRIEEELKKPLAAIAMDRLPRGQIIGCELVRRDSTVLKIRNSMYRIRERVEVGYLDFSLSNIHTSNYSLVELHSDFNTNLNASKIIMHDPDIEVEVEAGIIIRTHNGHNLSVVAADFPYMLAVTGAGIQSQSVREYPEANYRYILL